MTLGRISLLGWVMVGFLAAACGDSAGTSDSESANAPGLDEDKQAAGGSLGMSGSGGSTSSGASG